MINVDKVNALQGTNVVKNTSKNQKTSETNFKDTVSSVEGIKAVIDKIEKAIPGVYLNVVDWKKIRGFESQNYPIDKIYQKNLTLEDFNSFPRTKNVYMDCPETRAIFKSNRGKKAVLIHPDVLEKMSQDKTYADEIIAKVKKYTDTVGRVAQSDPNYPPCLTTSTVVSVDENGTVKENWSSGEGLGITESKPGVKNGKSKKDIEKERLEKYLEKLWLDRKLTQENILEIQMQRKENLARLQIESLLKKNSVV